MAYTDEELKVMSKERLKELFMSLPKNSLERSRVFKFWNAPTDRPFVPPTTPSLMGESKIESGKPIYAVHRITCVHDGSGKGFSMCLLDSTEGTHEVNHVDVIGLKNRIVHKHIIDPMGLTMDIEPTNIYLMGNAIIDVDIRDVFRRGEPGYVVTLREAMKYSSSGDIDKLKTFDWSPRKVSESVKDRLRKSYR